MFKWQKDLVSQDSSKKEVPNKNNLTRVHSLERYTCFYCPKVFIDTHYLLKHVSKQHSDMSTQIYKKMNEKMDYNQGDIFIYLKTEFSNVRKELRVLKNNVEECMKDRIKCKDSGFSQNMLTSDTSEEMLNPRSKLDEKMIKTQIQNLQNQMPETTEHQQEKINLINKEIKKVLASEDIKLKKIISDEIDNLKIMHQKNLEGERAEIKHELDVSEDKIFKWLKQSLINELHNMMDNLQKRAEIHKEEIRKELFSVNQNIITQFKSNITDEFQDKLTSNLNEIHLSNDQLKKEITLSETKILQHLEESTIKELKILIDCMQSKIDASKEDIDELKLHKANLSDQLQQYIINDIQNMVLDHKKDITNNYKEYLLDVRKEIKRLEETVNSYSKKVDSSSSLVEFEKKIENQLQNLLTSKSIMSNKKSPKLPQNCDSTARRQSKLRKRRRNCFSQATSSDLSKDTINMDNSPLRFKDSKVLGLQDGVKLSSSRKLQKENSEKKFNVTVKELQFLVEEKLKDLNIDPKVERLSPDDYERKVRLLNSEKEFYDRKFSSFNKTKTNLESSIENLIESQIEQRQTDKKLRFVDCPKVDQVLSSTPESERKGKIAKPSSILKQSPGSSSSNCDNRSSSFNSVTAFESSHDKSKLSKVVTHSQCELFNNFQTPNLSKNLTSEDTTDSPKLSSGSFWQTNVENLKELSEMSTSD